MTSQYGTHSDIEMTSLPFSQKWKSFKKSTSIFVKFMGIIKKNTKITHTHDASRTNG
ncbi:unnamed protein product [Arabidopsis halleri]